MKRLRRLFEITSGDGSQITSPITTGCIEVDSRGAYTAAVERLPVELDLMLSRCVAPGEEGAVAAVLEEAMRAGDLRLARFLDAVAARVERLPAPIRAEELRALLRAAG